MEEFIAIVEQLQCGLVKTGPNTLVATGLGINLGLLHEMPSIKF